MDHLRRQKNKNKQLKNTNLELENDITEINISITGMDSFKKKEKTKKGTITKTLGMIDTTDTID